MQEALLVLGAGVLGLLAAAVVNAKVMRTKETLLFTTQRKCAVCAEPVKAHEMLPVFGYFGTKGRCKRCTSVTPWQYPATELALAVLFGLFAARAVLGFDLPMFVDESEGLLLFVRDALVAISLVFIFMFDYKASVIPDRLSIPAMIVAILANIALGMPVEMILLGGFLIGGFFAVQFLLSHGRWVGGGDIRVGMLMGFLLGPWVGVVALLLSYILGSMVGIFLLVTKKRHLESHVPFGTFMALATLFAMVWGERVLNWYLGYFS